MGGFCSSLPSNLTLIEFWAQLTLGGHLIDSFLIDVLDRQLIESFLDQLVGQFNKSVI